MGIVASSIRATESLAATATAAVGALAGAAAGGAVGAAAGGAVGAAEGGVVGAARGGARGMAQGVGLGSRTLPAVALTVAVVGATGLVDWPLLIALGGTVVVLRQVRNAPAVGAHDPLDPVLQRQAGGRAIKRGPAAPDSPTTRTPPRTVSARTRKNTRAPGTAS